jgi:gas vesicle protein
MAQDNGSKVIWFLAGAAIGAAVALLYAPQSGEEVRRYLGDKAKEGRTALADSGHDMMERGRELFERGRKMADEAAEMFDRGRKIVNRAAEAAAENLPG